MTDGYPPDVCAARRHDRRARTRARRSPSARQSCSRVMLERNGLEIDDIVSVIFSATPDLRADFPAVAARSIGLSHTPLLCCQEIPVEGAIGRCIRVLMHVVPAGGMARSTTSTCTAPGSCASTSRSEVHASHPRPGRHRPLRARPADRARDERASASSEVVKLASNEFPLPPFAEVKKAILAAIDDLNRYPDGHSTDLRAALAAHYGVRPAQVAVGAGSCELLLLLGDVLLEKGDEVVFADPSFVVYNDVCLTARGDRGRGAAGRLRARSRGHGGGRHAAHQDGDRLQSQQPDRDLRAGGRHRAARRGRARRRAGRRRRGLQRVRDGAGRPGRARAAGRARERRRPAHVLEDLRPLRAARRLRPGPAGAERGPRQGAAAVQRQPPGAGGRRRGAQASGPGRPAPRRQRAAARRHGRARSRRAGRAHGAQRGQLHARRHARPLPPSGPGLRRAALDGRDRARRQRPGLPRVGARQRGYTG